MEITLVNGQRARMLDLASLRRFLARLAATEPAPKAERLAVRFVSDRAMRDYNHRYRGKDSSTDVLSFPAGGGPDPEGGRHLGDIVIAVPRAEAQAREAGHSLSKEIRILLIHGYLHLLGHDHETDDGEMRRLERRLARRLLPLRSVR